MGVISNPEMVAAVSEAGGYGLLATAFQSDPEQLKEQIEAVKRITDKPFGVNLMAMNPLSGTFAEIIADCGIRAITSSGGSPRSIVPILKARGVKILQVVANVANAVSAEKAGVDVIIAEGTESGGIQGYKGASTMVLVPMVADAVTIPVIAAGGIGDSRGYRAALALGAKGVQVGTRFIATKECVAHERYKNALIACGETDTVVLDRGRVRARVIQSLPDEAPAQEESMDETFTEMEGSLEDSWVKGNFRPNSLPSGEIAGMIKGVKSVREIIEEMVKE
jgi:enoyl-[acyl-carrier protein] reductase II